MIKSGIRLTLAAWALGLTTGNNPLESLPDASIESDETIRAWAGSLAPFGESQFTGTRMPSPQEWNDLSLYQIFTDRFNNGNETNDLLNMEEFQREEMNNGVYKNVHLYRHGGDIKGITKRLDYIKSLGEDAIFATSFLHNDQGMFHGYCVSNHLQIDPSFGTLEELQELTREAHKRGMYVIMDFVVNHLCGAGTSYAGQAPSGTAHDQCAETLYNVEKDDLGATPIPGQGQLQFSDTFFPPMKNQKYFSRCGPGLGESRGLAKYGDFVPWMFDLQTAEPMTHLLLTEMAKYWIAAADIDGFRLDATKHVSDSLLAYFSPHVRDYALSLGKDNFYVIGEVIAGADWKAAQVGTMAGGTTKLSQRIQQETEPLWSKHPKQKYPGTTAIYDTTHGGSTKDVAREERPPSLIDFNLGNPDRKAMTSQADDRTFWLLVDQHDWPRLLDGRPDQQGSVIAAYSYIHTARGMPLVYYGTEHGFNGECDLTKIDVGEEAANDRIRDHCQNIQVSDPVPTSFANDHDALYRQAMWDTAGYKLGMSDAQRTSTLAGIHEPRGANLYANWEEDPFLQDNDISRHLKRLNFIRHACTALRRGEQWTRNFNDQVFVFSRIYYEQEIIVAVNFRGVESDGGQVWIDAGIAETAEGEPYVNLLDQSETTPILAIEGGGKKIDVGVVAAHSVKIFVRRDMVFPLWNEQHASFRCSQPGDPILTSYPTSSPTRATSQATQSPTQQPTQRPTQRPGEHTSNETSTRAPVASTSDEEAAGGLGAGAVVGIVAAVVLLGGLGAVFLARRTPRKSSSTEINPKDIANHL